MENQTKEEEMFQWYINQSKKIFGWVSHIRIFYPTYYFSPKIQSQKETNIDKKINDKDLFEINVIVEDSDFQLSQMEKGNLSSQISPLENKKEYFLSQYEKQAHQFMNKKMKGKANQRELCLSLEQWKALNQDKLQEKMKVNILEWFLERDDLLEYLPCSLDEFISYHDKKKEEDNKKKLWNQLNPEEKKKEWALFLLRILHISYNDLNKIPKELYKNILESISLTNEYWEKHILWDKNDKLILHYKKMYWDNDSNFWDFEFANQKILNVKKNVDSLFLKKKR